MDRETIQKADKIWNSVLGKVELNIPKPSYDTWLRDTVGVSFISDEFNVETPNAFTAQYLEERMLDMLEQELRTIIGFDVKLKFAVINEIIISGKNEQPVIPSSPYSRSDPTAKHIISGHDLFQDPVSNVISEPRIESHDFNKRYTFENFIVGNSNHLAFAGAKAVSENPGTIFNPLVIHSPVGLGKTHLLQAIGHETKKLGLVVIYVTSEEFTNQYVRAIQNGQTEEFRNKYRTADVLLIDDIQFLIGKEQTQEGFFHTFNSLHVENKQIVVASDRNIDELRTLESRITSRLTGGLVTDIQAPQLETRIAILRGKAAQQRYDIPPNVIEFLGDKIRSNVRELEGLLNRVVALAQFRDEPITIESVKRMVGDSERINKEPISDSKIISEVSNYFGVTSDQIMGPLRTKIYLVPRQVAMFLLREETSLSLSAIGKILGGRDHSTVIHGHEKVASLINIDGKLRNDVLAIRNNLTGAAR